MKIKLFIFLPPPIPTWRSSDKDLGIDFPLSKNKSETDDTASDINLDHEKTSQEQVRKKTIHGLRYRDKLTIPET